MTYTQKRPYSQNEGNDFPVIKSSTAILGLNRNYSRILVTIVMTNTVKVIQIQQKSLWSTFSSEAR